MEAVMNGGSWITSYVSTGVEIQHFLRTLVEQADAVVGGIYKIDCCVIGPPVTGLHTRHNLYVK